MMMAALLEPKRDDGVSRRKGRKYRLHLSRLLWRCAFVLLATGGVLLKYQMIGPVGMRRIWHCADRLEHWAERLGYRGR